MNSSEKKDTSGIFQTLRSVQFGITILVAIAVVSLIGTVIPQGRSFDFYHEHYSGIVHFLITIFRFDITYGSPLFIGLLCLFGMNLTLCSLRKIPAILRSTFKPDLTPGIGKISQMPITATVEDKSLDAVERAFAESGIKLRKIDTMRLFGEKGRWGYMGSTVVHISIIMFLIGGLVSLITGMRGYIVLEKGQSTSHITLFDESTIPLGFELKLNYFEVEFYENYPNRPKSYKSSVTVSEPGIGVYDKDIMVNHPLMAQGLTIYQSSYGVTENDRSISDDDTVKVDITLKGAPDEMPPIVTLNMVQGKRYSVPGFGDSVSVRLDKVYRDFKRLQSVSGESNPAIQMDILVNGETRWSVFAFKHFPGLNMPMDQDHSFMFTMHDIMPGQNEAEKTEYYTVLGVVKDRGIPVMWAGAFIMITGLLFSFYIRPKRIWILQTERAILIGATTKGDTDPMRNFIHKTLKKIHT